MKPLKLTIKGIKSFQEEAVVDFEQLCSANLFGITGATRSGKSTILDAIITALYGRTPKHTAKSLINLQSDRMTLELEFEVAQPSRKRYAVKRVVRRKGSVDADLFELTSAGRVPLASGATAVKDAVQELIGLDQREFAHVVIMEQGEFNRFIKMTGANRNAMVGTIFSLEKYDMQERVKSERNRILNEVTALDASISTLNAPTPEEIKNNKSQLKQGRQELKQLEADSVKASLSSENALSALKVRESGLLKINQNRERLIEQEGIIAALRVEYESLSKNLGKTMDKLSATAERIRIEELNKTNALSVLHPYKTREEISGRLSQLVQEEGERATAEVECKRLTAELSELEREITTLEAAHLAAILQEKKDREDEERLKKQLGELERKGGEVAECVGRILPHLHAGDSCPVCGATMGEITPKNIAENDLKAYATARDLLDGVLSRLKQNSALLPSYGLRIDALRKEREKACKQLEENRQKLQKKSAVKVEDFRTAFRRLESALDELGTLGIAHARLAGEAATTSEKMASIEKQGKAVGELIKELKIGQDSNAEFELKSVRAEIEGFSKGELHLERVRLERAVREKSSALALLERAIEEGEKRREQSKELERERAVKQKRLDLLSQLAGLVGGRALLEFVADEYIQSFTYVANKVLNDLSLGDYRLLYTDIKRVVEDSNKTENVFAVEDNNNGGGLREVDTLSGGETFLVSLALAIAIGKEISSSRQFEFFFIDEGFGTLDNELIETVLTSIERLKSPTFNIGLITHRAELMSRLPVRLTVQRSDTQGSRIIW